MRVTEVREERQVEQKDGSEASPGLRRPGRLGKVGERRMGSA